MRSSSGKTSGIWIWATVVVLLVALAYPLSFGPSCWLASRFEDPHLVFEAIYWPLGWLANRTKPQSWDLLYPYAVWGMPDTGALTLPVGSREAPILIVPWDRQPAGCHMPDSSQ